MYTSRPSACADDPDTSPAALPFSRPCLHDHLQSCASTAAAAASLLLQTVQVPAAACRNAKAAAAAFATAIPNSCQAERGVPIISAHPTITNTRFRTFSIPCITENTAAGSAQHDSTPHTWTHFNVGITWQQTAVDGAGLGQVDLGFEFFSTFWDPKT